MRPNYEHQYKTAEELSETDKFKRRLAQVNSEAQSKDTSRYLVTVIIVLVIGVVSFIITLWIRPDYDPLLVAGIIFAFLTPTTTSLLSFIKAEEANTQAAETHLSVNNHFDAQIRQAMLSARQEGLEEGRKLADRRIDAWAQAIVRAQEQAAAAKAAEEKAAEDSSEEI